MSTISNCPKCAGQVTIPDGVAGRVANDEQVRCPLCGEEFPLHDAMAGVPPELIPVGGPATRTDKPAEPEKVASIHTIDTGRQSGKVEVFDLARPDEEPVDDSIRATAVRLRKSAKDKSLSRELFGVVVGGVVGLAIAYYLLNFFGGAQFDKLRVYLPGCPHTYDNWPCSPEPVVDEETPEDDL